MKIKLFPETKLGKWSVALAILMPILFCLGSLLTASLYLDTPSGKTILEDVIKRPILSFTMFLGMFSGIVAFAIGGKSILNHKERSLFVFSSTLIGALLLLFLLGEILSPH